MESAFRVLGAADTEIVQTAIPWEIVSLILLQEFSQTLDSSFACIVFGQQVRKTVNRIIANIYYNLCKSISESIRKDQVKCQKVPEQHK